MRTSCWPPRCAVFVVCPFFPLPFAAIDANFLPPIPLEIQHEEAAIRQAMQGSDESETPAPPLPPVGDLQRDLQEILRRGGYAALCSDDDDDDDHDDRGNLDELPSATQQQVDAILRDKGYGALCADPDDTAGPAGDQQALQAILRQRGYAALCDDDDDDDDDDDPGEPMRVDHQQS